MIVASASGVTAWARRRSSRSQARSGSALARGASTFDSALASGGSNVITRSSAGSWSRIAATLSACAAVETKMNRAPESRSSDGDLVGGQRRVDRHHHGAERQRGVVDHGPLGPVLREDGHPISRGEAPRVERRGDPGDSLFHLAIGHGAPRPVPLEANGFHPAEAVHPPVEDPCDGIPLDLARAASRGRTSGGLGEMRRRSWDVAPRAAGRSLTGHDDSCLRAGPGATRGQRPGRKDIVRANIGVDG